jgi:hypothetical protein
MGWNGRRIRCVYSANRATRVEEREIPRPDGSSKFYPRHRRPNGALAVCGASEIRALTPGYWRQLPLTPETMAAMFHEIFTRLAPQFRYKIRDDIYGAQTQVNVYRAALQHIATHSKDRNTVDDAIQALLEAPHLPLWDPRPWEQACELNRGLTIAVCGEMFEQIRVKGSDRLAPIFPGLLTPFGARVQTAEHIGPSMRRLHFTR